MPIFEYQAIDSQGKAVRGTLQSPDLNVATQRLAAKGLKLQQIGFAQSVGDPLANATPQKSIVTPIRPMTLAPRSALDSGFFGRIVGKVQLSDIAIFFRQLGAMLRAGVNPAECFDTLRTQTTSGKLATVLDEMKFNAEMGKPMSQIMERYPDVFTPLMIGLIRAGEKGGFLEKACADAAQYTEQEVELRNMLRRETFFPKLTLFGGLLVLGVANLIISSIGRGGQIDAPLNRLSTWYWLGPLIIGLFLFFRVVVPMPKFRVKWDGFLLRIPWLGGAVHRFAMAKFGRVFGAGYRGGMLIHESLRMAADSCGNEYIRAQLYTASSRLENGDTISNSLAATGVLSPVVAKMLSTGEGTGQLDDMLNKMADFYEDEAKTSSRMMAMVFGFAVLLGVGIYIGYVVISFWSGYFGSLFRGLEE